MGYHSMFILLVYSETNVLSLFVYRIRSCSVKTQRYAGGQLIEENVDIAEFTV